MQWYCVRGRWLGDWGRGLSGAPVISLNPGLIECQRCEGMPLMGNYMLENYRTVKLSHSTVELAIVDFSGARGYTRAQPKARFFYEPGSRRKTMAIVGR